MKIILLVSSGLPFFWKWSAWNQTSWRHGEWSLHNRTVMFLRCRLPHENISLQKGKGFDLISLVNITLNQVPLAYFISPYVPTCSEALSIFYLTTQRLHLLSPSAVICPHTAELIKYCGGQRTYCASNKSSHNAGCGTLRLEKTGPSVSHEHGGIETNCSMRLHSATVTKTRSHWQPWKAYSWGDKHNSCHQYITLPYGLANLHSQLFIKLKLSGFRTPHLRNICLMR